MMILFVCQSYIGCVPNVIKASVKQIEEDRKSEKARMIHPMDNSAKISLFGLTELSLILSKLIIFT